jgi:hypothetical protein
VRGNSKLAVVLCCVLAAALLAAPAAQAKTNKRVDLRGAKQGSVLKRGLVVSVKGPGRFKLRATSATFDGPDGRLAKVRSVRVRGKGRRTVRLKLNAEGRREVSLCAKRTITVSAGKGRKRRDSADLFRTGDCAPGPVDLSRPNECDWIGQQQGSTCLLPYPSDFHTATAATATGRRLALQAASMPRNFSGTPINPADYNRLDGWSPGSTIIARVPGLDNPAALAATDAAPINQIGRYAAPDQPVVVIDAVTGKRHPVWTEIDSNAGSAANTGLQIHPAVNFASGRRYIVALRDLRRSDGSVIGAPPGFRYLRDDLPTDATPIISRKPAYEKLFAELRAAGIRRSDLYLAWDFTVGTDESIARQMLHMRDDAFGDLGDDDLSDLTVEGAAPAFSVDTVNDFTLAEDPEVARRIRGTFTVPCYLEPNCAPAGRFDPNDPDGLPDQNGTWTANFDCIVPRKAIDGPMAVPGRASTYGHGLFGAAQEVFQSGIQQQLANDHGFTFCATDEIGMSGADVPNTAGQVLSNLSNFPMLADRLHQGLLNGLFLGRLMIHDDGFLSHPAFHVDGVSTASPPVIDNSELYYEGSSQGGIFGGALTAIAPDFTRSVLNVPAMNYSVLLPRSIDYDPFAVLLNGAYTNALERPLILSLIQNLWDRSEPNGYAHRMTTNPLPDTPAHKVLMNVAFGDHQVTNFQADVQARTIGASTHVPVLYPGRWPGVDVLWNVPAITSYPFDGSAVVYGDIGPVRPNPSPPPAMIGVPPPPLTNTAPRAGEDPHGAPRGAPLALQLISDFLAPGGAVTNPCGASACYAGGFTGP